MKQFHAPKYRSDIDGLRVVMFHAFPSLLKGGFIGVDIFFVISGYLISTIIFENHQNNTFDFSVFYVRRIKRIFPSLILVLLFCLGIGALILLADEYQLLGKHVVAGTAFIENFTLWKEAGYFDQSAETKPLLHLWSLGIEEQFYIFWPLLLALAWKRKYNIYVLLALLIVGSFGLNIYLTPIDASAAFYLPQSRFWELLSGSLLAWFLLKKSNQRPLLSYITSFSRLTNFNRSLNVSTQTLKHLISVAGATALIVGFLLINQSFLYPGYWALLPIIGSVFLIYANNKSLINHYFLSNKILVWFGLISYPLYLWHWPILVFLRILDAPNPSVINRIFAIFLSILLAWISTSLIEHPIRFKLQNKFTTIFLILGMCVVGILAYFVIVNNGLDQRVNPQFNKLSKAHGEWQFPGSLKSYPFKDRQFLAHITQNKTTTLFIGDSNMEQYYVRIDELANKSSNTINSFIFATDSGCLPIPKSPYDEIHGHCHGLMEAAKELALNNPEIKKIVIAGQWNQYLNDGAALVGTFGYGSDNYKKSIQHLTEYIQDLTISGKQVYLILNIPTGTQLDPKYMAQRSLINFPNVFKLREGGINRQDLENNYGLIQYDLKQAAKKANAIVINPLDFVCSPKLCPSIDNKKNPIYKDAGHLHPDYVRNQVNFIDITVF